MPAGKRIFLLFFSSFVFSSFWSSCEVSSVLVSSGSWGVFFSSFFSCSSKITSDVGIIFCALISVCLTLRSGFWLLHLQ